MSLLVHGITDAGAAEAVDPEALASARGERVWTVTGGQPPHTAFVSEVADDDVLPTRELLGGHARLLEALHAATTVLPLRFGTTVPSARELCRDVLEARAPQLSDRLERVRGHAEWRLRGRHDETLVLRELVAGDRRIARLRGREDHGARLQLGELIVAALEERRANDLELASSRLATASAVRPGPSRDPLDALALSALVREELTADFEAQAAALADQLAPTVSLELSGPHPPYSFVEDGWPWDS